MVLLRPLKHLYPIYQGPGAKPYTFVWIATPGIMIFIAGIVGGFIQKQKLAKSSVHWVAQLKLEIHIPYNHHSCYDS